MIHYVIYFTWKDGTKDKCVEYGAVRRNMMINYLLTKENLNEKKEIVSISYCKIYKNGKYGDIIKVI